jgi:hypothetical protein
MPLENMLNRFRLSIDIQLSIRTGETPGHADKVIFDLRAGNKGRTIAVLGTGINIPFTFN